jgi:uncharacterized membrane protein
MDSNRLRNVFAMCIGTFLLIQGIWGLFSQEVFGVFTTNFTHSLLNIVLGMAGIYYGYEESAQYYSLFLGTILISVGLLRFLFGPSDSPVYLFNINEAVAYYSIFMGTVALILGSLSHVLINATLFRRVINGLHRSYPKIFNRVK